jgi:hypothetical protein
VEILGKLIEAISKVFSPRLMGALFLLFLTIVVFPSLPRSLPILGLLGTGFYLATYPIHAFWKAAARYAQEKQSIRRGQDRLHHLTSEEKKLLQSYVKRGTRTRRWNVGSGVVNGLVRMGILFSSSNIGSQVEGFAYGISEWAFEYLNAHQELIATPGDTSEPDAYP